MAPSNKRKPRTRNPPKDTFEEVERKINARKFLREREFSQTSDYKFYSQAKAHGLAKLLGKRRRGNALFVRQYYLHDAFHHASIALRDKQVIIGPDSIRKFYGLPVIAPEKCMYAKLKEAKDDFPYSQIAAELVLDGEDTWFAPNNHERYLARADLTPEAKCWLHLVANNILPTSHTTRLTRHLCLLIFLLKTNQPVQLEEIIYQAITSCSQTHSHKLVFPHLISDLFIKAKVPQLDTDPKFNPRPAFNYTHVLSHKNPTLRDQMRNRALKPPSPTTQQISELHKKVDRVERKLDQLYDLFTRFTVFQGFPMDRPESSSANTAAGNLLELGGVGNDVNATSDPDEPVYTAENDEDTGDTDDEGDGPGTASMEDATDSEYDPDDDLDD